LRPHRDLERVTPIIVRGIESVGRNERDVRQVKENTKPQVIRARQWRRERPEQNFDRSLVVGRQMGA
jgi:hypothetical protein